MLTTTALALSLLLTLTQEEATRPEPPAPAAVEAPGPSESPAPEATEHATPGKRELSRIILEDGQTLRGVVVRRDAQVVVVELAAGGRLELPAQSVKSVEAEPHAQVRGNGEVWIQDPNRTRYLYAPSGMMLHQGEGYFSQKELLFSSMNYGLTDHITLQAGAALPLFLLPDGQGLNFIGGLKVGGSVTDRLHLAVGAQGLFVPGLLGSTGGMGAGFLFGTATYGTPDAHLSLAVGTPFILARNSDVFPHQLITTLSGNLRVSQQLALVTENWLVPTLITDTRTTLPMVNALALRIFGEHWAVDIGGIHVPEVPIPLPWLDFSYNFG